MTTVTIYKNTCTQGVMMSEQGTGFSLTEWGSDTDMIKGFDDGGQNYVLPDGYTLGAIWGGLSAVFDTNDNYCELVMHSCGRPQLVSGDVKMPVLSLAD